MTKSEKIKQKSDNVVDEAKLVDDIKQDFENRKNLRKSFDAQWQLNMNFLMGNQYCAISSNGEVEEYSKQYFWQEREVFNHLATLVETRLSKLTNLRPKMSVIPASGDERDIKTAALSKKILQSVCTKLNLQTLISEATKWSETCGTAFYKIAWNSCAGKVLAKDENGKAIMDGDVEISVCSPFEIYPDSCVVSDIEDCQSIIHAKVYPAKIVNQMWGVNLAGRSQKVFSMGSGMTIGGLGYSTSASKITDAEIEDGVLVIERYQKPDSQNPLGRLTIIADDTLLYDGELPYINGTNSQRVFPFVKQVCLPQAGNFWGVSVIERTIPIQRAYNAVKNRKHEFLNRISMGVLNVEDGSVDIENLEDEGLSPGKILVYRQGSNPPSFMASGHVPTDFTIEEERLLNEFERISGVSDLLHSKIFSQNISGVALSLMIEQDQARIACTSDSLKNAVMRVGEMILRLYKQFAIVPKLLKVVGDRGEVEMFYFSSGDITSDEVVFETETEVGQSLAQRRNMILELLNKGLLTDENGKLSNAMRAKLLELLGFGLWQDTQDLNSLHMKKASKENLNMLEGEQVKVLEVDDHDIHINEHIAFMLGGEYEKAVQNNKNKEKDSKLEEKFLNHIRLHKQMRAVQKQIETEEK